MKKKVVHAFRQGRTNPSSALQPARVIQVVAAVGRCHGGELQLPRPLLAGLQRDGPLDRGRIDAQHLLVLVVAKVCHHLGLLLPGVPHN